MSETPQPCVFCHTTKDVGYCNLCKKWMCSSCAPKYWMRFNAAVSNARAKLHLGGRRY